MAASSEAQESSSENKPTDETESHVSGTENNKVKLEDLKVAELKNELEKRDLDKNGVKSVLVERLKAAIVEEGENPEEYKFEISSDTTSVKSSPKKLKAEESDTKVEESDTKVEESDTKAEESDTNAAINAIDETNNSEEKQEVALQLSLDEEEAQLNEESLIEVTKDCDTESSKTDGTEQLNNDFSTSEKITVSDKQSTPPRNLKVQVEDAKEKKIGKTPLQNKSTEGAPSVSPKVSKVVAKNEKLKSSTVLAKSLWITGLPNTTRAADLKTLFSKQGKVLSVKIVKSAKQTPAKCYGIVTMATSKDATKAIQNLHRTELNGRVISVERKQGETAAMLKKSEAKTLTATAKKGTAKKETSTPKQISHVKDSGIVKSKETSKVENKTDEKKPSSEDSSKKAIEKTASSEKSKDKDRKPRERVARDNRDRAAPARRPANFRPRQFGYNDRPRFDANRRPFNRRPFASRFGFNSNFRPRSNIVNLQRLREERFQGERLRERRETERRREDDLTRHRFVERQQREEAYRLEREKEKLRFERELLERERSELLKLEREKQMLERERLEHERDELKRQAELRRGSKRPFSRVERDHEPIWEERKKSTPRYDIRSSFRGDLSAGGSRFEFPSRERTGFTREYDRHPDKYSSPKHLEVLPRSDFVDRDARREITIRPREDRQIFNRGDFRDNRRSLSSRDQERHSSTRREAVRSDWKADRRVPDRVISSNSSSGQRRMTYY